VRQKTLHEVMAARRARAEPIPRRRRGR
jgi:hypothetical protein